MLFKSEPRTKTATLTLIFLFALLVYGVLTSCNNDSKEPAFKHSPPDTIRTFLVYNANGLKWDVSYRISLDSLMFNDIDSVTQKKTWVRTKLYFIPFYDSVRNKVGEAVKDSLGKYQVRLNSYIPIPNNLIYHDSNFSLDSLVKQHIPK